MTIKRRRFIQAAVAGAAAGSLQLQGAPAIHAQSKGKVYRTALIGSGWWGMNILKQAMAAGNIKCVALCDVDQDKLELAAEEVSDLSSDSPKTYTDFRELLDKEAIDIAIVATPDHWHALNTIAAIEKGAHIFVEKPTGHTVLESRAMLNAARANDRVVQVGLHRRIGPHYVSGMKFLKDGGAGEIGLVRAFVYSKGGVEQPTPNSPPPEQLDWDLYCGPAPLRPFNRKIHPGGFRNFLDFANGTLRRLGGALARSSVVVDRGKISQTYLFGRRSPSCRSSGAHGKRTDDRRPGQPNSHLPIRVLYCHLGTSPLCRQWTGTVIGGMLFLWN